MSTPSNDTSAPPASGDREPQLIALIAELAHLKTENTSLREQNASLAARSKQNNDPSVLVAISHGGFGFVRTYAHSRVAYKTTFDSSVEARDHLVQEFKFYAELDTSFDIIRADRPVIFASPKPLSVWDPISSSCFSISRSDMVCHVSSASESHRWMWRKFTNPTMSVELIPALHPFIGERYRSLFFGKHLQSDTSPIHLLRLYLGRQLDPTTQELKSGVQSDLPLDIDRYTRLSESLSPGIVFPTLQDIATGMGQVLATLHWSMGIDGSDIELVIGGDSLGAEKGDTDHRPDRVEPYVLDYNKCARWAKSFPCDPSSYDFALNPSSREFRSQLSIGHWTKCTIAEAAQKLAVRIGGLELYYPSPSVNQDLYTVFKTAYIATVRSILDHHSTTFIASTPEDGSDQEERIQRVKVLDAIIDEAVKGFFYEWESLDARRADKGRSFRSPAVSDAFRALLSR